MIAYRLRCAVTRLLLKLAKRWHTDSLIAYRNYMLKDASKLSACFEERTGELRDARKELFHV